MQNLRSLFIGLAQKAVKVDQNKAIIVAGTVMGGAITSMGAIFVCNSQNNLEYARNIYMYSG